MASRSPLDDWKHQAAPRPARPGGNAPSMRQFRLRFALVPVLLASGTALGILSYLRAKPEPLFLSVSVGEYDGWPDNAFARQDGEGLREFFPNGKVVSQGQQQATMIMAELTALAETAGKGRSKPVVIHVCALAGVDQGEVAILPAKAKPGEPDTWLKLSDLLAAVDKVRGERLLILDIRPVVDPRLGQAGEDVAAVLHSQLAAAESNGGLPFIVLAQCAPGEYPYVSPEFGRGVLAEFLRRGLAGHADQAGDHDDQVSAEELVAYARARTAHWLTKHQAPPAATGRYGKAADFVLVSVPRRGPPDEPFAEPRAVPAGLAEGWKAIETWRAEGAVHQAPRTLRQLEEAVMLADRRWTGGGAETDLVTVARDLTAQRTALKLKDYPVASVGRARRKEVPKDKEDAVKKLMEQLVDPIARPAKKDDPPPKPVEIPKELPEPPPYDAIVSATLKRIDDLTKEPTIEQLQQYAAFLHALKSPHPEVALLAFFADPEKSIQYRELWPAEAPRVALRAAIESWRAASVDGRAFKRIESALGEANADFRKAMGLFFKPMNAPRNEAVRILRDVTSRYRGVIDLGEAYEQALTEWEETVALLPAVADFTPENATARQELDAAWTDLVEKAGRVRQALDGSEDAAGLKRSAAELTTRRQRLGDLLKTVPADATPAEWRARLRLPVWTPAEREQRTAQASAAALELARQALRENAPAVTSARPTAEDPRFADLAALRVKRANDLLALAGEPRAAGGGVAMRRALVDQLRDRYGKDATPTARERFAWLVDPADVPALPEAPGRPPNDPGPQARREAEQAFVRWLVKEHVRPLAAALDAQPAEAAKALARELDRAARALDTYP